MIAATPPPGHPSQLLLSSPTPIDQSLSWIEPCNPEAPHLPARAISFDVPASSPPPCFQRAASIASKDETSEVLAAPDSNRLSSPRA